MIFVCYITIKFCYYVTTLECYVIWIIGQLLQRFDNFMFWVPKLYIRNVLAKFQLYKRFRTLLPDGSWFATPLESNWPTIGYVLVAFSQCHSATHGILECLSRTRVPAQKMKTFEKEFFSKSPEDLFKFIF